MSGREYRKMVRALAKEFQREIKWRNSGHISLVCPENRRPVVFTSGTASDHRAIKNLRMQLRHAEVPIHET